MEQENQRIAISRRLLKESLLRLLKEKEIDKITISELCRDACVNRSTFYRYYEIPQDVLTDIQKDLYYKIRKDVPMPKTVDGIKISMEKLFRSIDENKNMLRLLILNNSDTDFANFISDIYMEIWHDCGQIPILKELKPEEIQLLMFYCTGGSYSVLRSWLMGDIRGSAQEMADYVWELLSRMDIAATFASSSD